LPRFTKSFASDFYQFADCGAAVGHTALAYRKIQEENLPPSIKEKAKIYCYEPLPENLKELMLNTFYYPEILVRPVAVSNFIGKSSFAIPRRAVGESSHWGHGTSAVGFLGSVETFENIEVPVVRLDSDCQDGFDFVKLDLQGGEKSALQGLGSNIMRAKLIYSEFQLLTRSQDSTLSFLLDCGFICFFDRLQIGIKADQKDIPLTLLSNLGLVVEQLILTRQAEYGARLYGAFIYIRYPTTSRSGRLLCTNRYNCI
jgi:FkbM family methyltransferase